MTERKLENPAAFGRAACAVGFEGHQVVDYGDSGMTLRDYFAAHCPITFTEFLSGWKKSQTATMSESLDAYAELRMWYGDSMLKARAV